MFAKIPSRLFSSLPDAATTSKCVFNKNPRNLERLRIARKPQGYHLDRLGREYWHTLYFTLTKKHITGQIIHNSGNVVVSASTNEWALKKHLFNTNDISAYSNLAQVLAQRCLESGISEITCNYKAEPNTKFHEFLKVLESSGVSLTEPEVFTIPRSFEKENPEKPWEVVDN
uniref:Large ribosomal subunit protein uL18m n=1 Tax=Cacopsylla melanoneura TaxID=428564 RepID=A0A8D8XKQ4_9HEMI